MSYEGGEGALTHMAYVSVVHLELPSVKCLVTQVGGTSLSGGSQPPMAS